MTRLDRLARSTRGLLNTLAAITGKEPAEEALSVVHSLNFRSALGIFSKAAQNSAAVSNSRSSASRTGRGRCGAGGA